MPAYQVNVTVEVDVVMDVTADNEDAARGMVEEGLAVDVRLVDVPAENFTVQEDGISDLTVKSVEPC